MVVDFFGNEIPGTGERDEKFSRIYPTQFRAESVWEDGVTRYTYFLTTQEALQYLKCSRVSLWKHVPVAEDFMNGKGFKYPRLYSDKALVAYKQKLDAAKAKLATTATELKVD